MRLVDRYGSQATGLIGFQAILMVVVLTRLFRTAPPEFPLWADLITALLVVLAFAALMWLSVNRAWTGLGSATIVVAGSTLVAVGHWWIFRYDLFIFFGLVMNPVVVCAALWALLPKPE